MLRQVISPDRLTWELWATKMLSCLEQNNAKEDYVFTV